MIDFYVKLVLAGKMTIEEVPLKYREAVRRRIEEMVKTISEGRNG